MNSFFGGDSTHPLYCSSSDEKLVKISRGCLRGGGPNCSIFLSNVAIWNPRSWTVRSPKLKFKCQILTFAFKSKLFTRIPNFGYWIRKKNWKLATKKNHALENLRWHLQNQNLSYTAHCVPTYVLESWGSPNFTT